MSKQKKGIILISILLGFILSSLDNTIISASMGNIIADIGGLDKITWMFTTYALAGTSTMLIFGKLSDMFGRKTFYLIGIGLFLLGSALCGTAGSIEQLIVYRVIQGIGSGAIFPISLSLIYTLFNDPKDAAKMSGLFGAVLGLSSIGGPLLGAWVSESLNWRWCFYINLPIGIVSFVSLLCTLRESRSEAKPKIDILGALLIVIMTVSAMFALELGGKDYAWSSWLIIGLFAISALAMIAFYFVEQRASEPIVPLQLFKNRMVTGTNIVVFCQGALLFSAMTYLPLYAMYVFDGFSVKLLLTPLMLSMICGSVLIGYLQAHFRVRTVMFVNMVLGIGISILLMNLSLEVPHWQIIALAVVLGLGVLGPLNNITQNAVAYSVDKRYIGVSASLVGFSRSIGGVMGVSVMAVIVNLQMKSSVTTAIGKFQLLPNPDPNRDPLNPETVFRFKDYFEPQLVSFYKLAMGNAINQGFALALCVTIIGAIAALTVGASKLHKRSDAASADTVTQSVSH
ncbi:DHA2 family efflux MFS transporter permease subunit [Paenibacillus durus]|uniref:DHA2 family efflux MFS transporter permease subunit n=1 Tax=Paenibacillus durus TaxID=44251 RepID=UPI0004AD378C|nr:DHA2 family efflux MFS transporter permease subunit [Paenibacillus durus]